MVNVTPATKEVGQFLLVVVDWTNTGEVDSEFMVGVSIGSDALHIWHDTDIYTDGLGNFVGQYVPAGGYGEISRQMVVPNDAALLGPPGDYAWDVWVRLLDPSDTSIVLDEYVAVGALTVHVPDLAGPEGEITAISLS